MLDGVNASNLNLYLFNCCPQHIGSIDSRDDLRVLYGDDPLDNVGSPIGSVVLAGTKLGRTSSSVIQEVARSEVFRHY